MFRNVPIRQLKLNHIRNCKMKSLVINVLKTSSRSRVEVSSALTRNPGAPRMLWAECPHPGSSVEKLTAPGLYSTTGWHSELRLRGFVTQFCSGDLSYKRKYAF